MLIEKIMETVHSPPSSPNESYDLSKGGVWGCERDILYTGNVFLFSLFTNFWSIFNDFSSLTGWNLSNFEAPRMHSEVKFIFW